MALNFMNIGDLSGLYSEYANIKNGTYKKLLNAYYSKTEGSGKNNANEISELLLNSNNKLGKNALKDVKVNSDSLSISVTSLMEKGVDSVFNKKEIERIDEKTGEKVISKEYDVKTIKEKVNDFISDYNAVIESSANTDSTKVMQKTIDMIENTKIYKDSLEKIGISIGSDNKLTLNEEKFESANMTSVKSLFNDTNSLGQRTMQKALQIGKEAYKDQLSANLYTSTGNYNSYDYHSLLNMYL